MTSEVTDPAGAAFSEKGFYLSEFRGRTLALAVSAGGLGSPAPLEAVLKELEVNGTRIVLVSTDRIASESLLRVSARTSSSMTWPMVAGSFSPISIPSMGETIIMV